ncbi:MAG: DUF72 domain-containing protein [Chloroflexi bacterium]|nr:DUF72 domain-containing protein [Chloroflexota bacterium]
MNEIRIGTMGWSYADWVGPFFSEGARPATYLSEYARHFDCVELDTTFYAVPRASAVRGWMENTPPGFRFAAKLPKEITHEQHLHDSAPVLHRFLDAMSPLGEKLGPVLVQLPPDFHATDDNRAALQEFVHVLPEEYHFAAEFRHRSWLTDDTLDLLRQHGVAWTIIDMYYMPKRLDITSDFTYVRLLGDRRKIQQVDHIQIDRTGDLQTWADAFGRMSSEVTRAWVFVNNHYAGHSPQNVRQLRGMVGLPPEATPSAFDLDEPSPADEGEQARMSL